STSRPTTFRASGSTRTASSIISRAARGARLRNAPEPSHSHRSETSATTSGSSPTSRPSRRLPSRSGRRGEPVGGESHWEPVALPPALLGHPYHGAKRRPHTLVFASSRLRGESHPGGLGRDGPGPSPGKEGCHTHSAPRTPHPASAPLAARPH